MSTAPSTVARTQTAQRGHGEELCYRGEKLALSDAGLDSCLVSGHSRAVTKTGLEHTRQPLPLAGAQAMR